MVCPERRGSLECLESCLRDLQQFIPLQCPVLYVNALSSNVGVFTTPTTLPADSDASRKFSFGSETGTNFFDGSIDEVRIYSRILTAAEIKALYAQGR